jgi:hypothetical protein
MILIGRVRGNGAQLANYLMKSPANDNAEVFDIRGTLHKDDIYLSLREMSLTSELTKSKQGIFHLVINPPQNVSMSAEDWLTCTRSSKSTCLLPPKNGRWSCMKKVMFTCTLRMNDTTIQQVK